MFFDHVTRYIWLYPMKRKSDVQVIFPKFKSLVENFHKQQIKILYTDNVGEYIGLHPFLRNHGISHHNTPLNIMEFQNAGIVTLPILVSPFSITQAYPSPIGLTP